MNPALIVFGIQASLRAAQAGADLYKEHARDRKVFLPNLELPPGSRSVQLHRFLMENPQLAGGDPELSAVWDKTHKELTTTTPELIDAAYAVMLRHKAKLQLLRDGKSDDAARREAEMLSAGRMVEQWREERTPPSAMIRMALTLTDIGLEYVSSDPSILGVGSRGEKLIVAFAKNLSALIPNDVATFGPGTDFADRVLGIFLRSGLGALSSNAAAVFRDEDIATLLAGVTKPIVDALPDNIADQIHYRDLVDALAGPSAEAAFKLLAENTETYLGRDFANDKALGAVTSALFEEIKSTSRGGAIVDAFSEQGVIRLYQAGLGVAVDRPGLFTGGDDSAKRTLFQELIRGTAATLRANPRFKGPIGASLAAMAVEVVGRNAPAILRLNPDEPWEKVAEIALAQLTTGLSSALNHLDDNGLPKGALKAFSDAQLLQLGRVILAQAAETPGMLGVARSEVQVIIAAMAAAMAADEYLLLSADGWIKIAGIAAKKAATDPGRLFGLSTDAQGEGLAVSAITSVLAAAGAAWTAGGRSKHQLLFGETLETALAVVIEGLCGNVAAVAAEPEVVERFLRKLLADASDNPEKYGSEGLLTVLSVFIGSVLANGTLPGDKEIDDALSV